MPGGALHLLRWSSQEQRYTITIGTLTLPAEITASRGAWTQWLDMVPSFAFENRAGVHCTIRKERLQRGDAYWYAYRSIQGRTKKRYLGRTADLSLERLEEISVLFTAEEREALLPPAAWPRSVPTQQRIQTTTNREIAPVLTPFLETKLHPPRLPALLVSRSRLLTMLDAGQRQKLTLLHAPAGFGKTTLVTQWIAYRQAQAEAYQHSPSPVAWISLDSGDNDPIRFWSSIIAACQTFHAHIGQAALELLSQLSFKQAPLETALAALLNDLACSVQERVLVLEEYHLIEHARIHETMAFFIEHLPASLHVVILTRSEPPLPLVRWRARGDLMEVHPPQLRFSLEETATFLQQVIPQAFSEEAVRSLHTHLEGWAAGLRLLALSLQSQMTPQAIEDALMRLNTSSAADRTHRPIQEFFLSEVLSAQPKPLQLFLLQTSILSRLTGSLCDAVTGRQDSAEWLEVAERSGFFLEALDSQGAWYRYHTLFAETMRAEAARRLGEAELCHLSALASRWYEKHAMLVEAIEAALSAQEFEYAAHLIERLNESAYFSEYHTMRRWLEQFPEPLLRAHPALCFLSAQARLFAEDTGGPLWRIEPVEDLLQMAEEGWRKQGDLPQVGILYAFRATFTVIHGLIAPAVTYARQALQLLPPLASEQPYDHPVTRPAEWIEWHCGCLIALGLDAMQEGSFDKAQQVLLEAYTLSLNNEDRVFTRVIGRLLGDVSIELGELHQAASYYQQTLAEAHWPDERGEGIFRAQTAYGLIRLAYEWNELETAEQLAREASLYRYRGGFPYAEEDARMRVELLRLLLLHARGEVAEARAALSALFVRLQATPNTLPLISDVLAWQARLQVRDGDLAGAERTLGTLANHAQDLSLLQQETRQLLHARLLLARDEAETALPMLERCLAFAQQGKHVMRALEIELLIALAHAALKQGHKARQQLSLVLAQARSEGFLRLFLDEGEPLAALLRSLLPSLTDRPLRAFAQSILHACTASLPTQSASRNGTESSLLEPLSAQEQRVLALLVAGRSNPEIAETLIVSVNTVKGHVKNLYRKLNVNTRMQASEVARRFKLI